MSELPECNIKNKAIINFWIESLYSEEFKKHVENDIGGPVRVIVDWKNGKVIFEGSRISKSFRIKGIIDGEYDE